MHIFMALLIALTLVSGCSKKKKKSNEVNPVVISATITNPANGIIVPNQALTVSGICVATANGASVAITVGTITKFAACFAGAFSIEFDGSEVNSGSQTINLYNYLGANLGSSSVNVSPCSLFQDFDGAVTCTDRAITLPGLSIASVTNLSGTDFVTSSALTLSIGTTVDAKKMHIFSSVADCNNFSTNTCQLDDTTPLCVAITHQSQDVSATVNYNPLLTSGGSANVVILYSNETELSACLPRSVTLDTQGPSVGLGLSGAVTYDPSASVVLDFGGSAIADLGGAGLASIEVAIGTSIITQDVLPYTGIATNSTSYSATGLGSVLVPGTNYYFLVRATDNLGNETNSVSTAFQYQSCLASQSLVTGSCVDKAVITPQVLITSGSNIGGNRFTTDRNLVLSMGTTNEALRMIVLKSTADCSAHIANDCYTGSPQVACLGIASEEFTPSLTMNYNYAELVSGTARDVAVYYINGTATSACVSAAVTLDTSAPSFTIAQASTVTLDSNLAPEVSFSPGPITDVGGSGIGSVSVGISSNGTTANIIALSTIPLNSTSRAVDTSSVTLVTGTNYYTIVRAVDNLGNTHQEVTPIWQYSICNPAFQIDNGDGTCTDRAIGTPQIILSGFESARGIQYVASTALTLQRGTTDSTARSLLMFTSSIDCSTWRTNLCHVNAGNAGCAGISPVQLTPAASMTYNYPSMTVNSDNAFSGYYTNGSYATACISDSAYLNQPTTGTVTLTEDVVVGYVDLNPMVSSITNASISAITIGDIPFDGTNPTSATALATLTPSLKTNANSLLVTEDLSADKTITVSATLSSGNVVSCNPNIVFTTTCTFTAADFSGAFNRSSLKTLNGKLKVATGSDYEVTVPFKRVILKAVYTQTATTNNSAASLKVLNDKLFFTANNASSRRKLFFFDGADVTQISDIAGTEDHDMSSNFYQIYSGEIYFPGFAGGITKLYKTDGETHITRVSNIRGNGASDNITRIYSSNGSFYMSAWRTSDTANKMMIVTPTSIGIFANQRPSTGDLTGIPGEIIRFNGDTYASLAKAGGAGFINKLVRRSGTVVNMLADNNPTLTDMVHSFFEFNSELYFVMNNASSRSKLYKTDGVTVTQLSDINAGANDFIGTSWPGYTIHGGELYFYALQGADYKLFKLSGSAITRISNTNPGGGDLVATVHNLYTSLGKSCNGKLYFSLIPSGATTATLHMLEDSKFKQLASLTDLETASNLECYRNELYFTGSTPAAGSRLFKVIHKDEI